AGRRRRRAGSAGPSGAGVRRSWDWRRSDPRAPVGPPGGRSLPALLHVGLHELLGVLLQDLVDLVQDLVHLLLQLLALGGRLTLPGLSGSLATTLLLGALLLLLLRHRVTLLSPIRTNSHCRSGPVRIG